MIDIFHNRERPNYEEIITYGPRWWLEWLEMNANYRYAGWTLDLMAYWIERAISNLFPMHADEYTISKLEKLLNIEMDPDSTLDDRRRIVAAALYGIGHLSRTVIQTIIRTYTGFESTLWWSGDGDDENILNIAVHWEGSEDSGDTAIAKIMKTLDRRMPAHIAMEMSIRTHRDYRKSGGLKSAFCYTHTSSRLIK